MNQSTPIQTIRRRRTGWSCSTTSGCSPCADGSACVPRQTARIAFSMSGRAAASGQWSMVRIHMSPPLTPKSSWRLLILVAGNSGREPRNRGHRRRSEPHPNISVSLPQATLPTASRFLTQPQRPSQPHLRDRRPREGVDVDEALRLYLLPRDGGQLPRVRKLHKQSLRVRYPSPSPTFSPPHLTPHSDPPTEPSSPGATSRCKISASP